MPVELQNFSIKVEEALEEAALQFLEEASHEVASAAARNSRVATGQLKGSWENLIDDSKMEATVGSPLENAIWEEFGTGEYALGGNGRKGGWTYVDDNGEGHFTHGKKPNRTLFNAFEKSKPKIIRRAEQIFKERMGG